MAASTDQTDGDWDFEERRAIARKNARIDGQLVWSGLFMPLACHIFGITEQGARVEVLRSVHVPDEFELIIPDLESIISVRRVWRDGTTVGVSFAGEPRKHLS